MVLPRTKFSLDRLYKHSVELLQSSSGRVSVECRPSYEEETTGFHSKSWSPVVNVVAVAEFRGDISFVCQDKVWVRVCVCGVVCAGARGYLKKLCILRSREMSCFYLNFSWEF